VHLFRQDGQGALRPWRSLLSPAPGDGFGEAVAAAGDLDGDGYGELAVADFAWERHRGRVLVYRGGPDGLREAPAWAFEGEQAGDWFGYSLCGPGDLDGDGFADLAISGKNCSGACTLWLAQDPRFEIHRRYVATQASADAAGTAKAGRVSIYFGGLQGPQAGLQREGGHPHAFYGFKLAALGDLDGDGLPELGVSAPGWMARRGLIEALSLSRRRAARVAVLEGSAEGAELGQSLGSPGDLDNDGRPELAAGSVREGSLWLWWGRSGYRGQPWDLRLTVPDAHFVTGPEPLGPGRFVVGAQLRGRGTVLALGLAAAPP
jgi:hypothetical protein